MGKINRYPYGRFHEDVNCDNFYSTRGRSNCPDNYYKNSVPRGGYGRNKICKQRGRHPQRLNFNPYLIESMNLWQEPLLSYNFTLSELMPYDNEYLDVLKHFTNPVIVVDSIKKVHNPYIERAYLLKREEKEKMYGHVRELMLFHGTQWENIESICRNNFDWRLSGINVGHKYGQGVSFSTKPAYAAFYSSCPYYQRVMIAAKVLVVRSCVGHRSMVLPPDGYDTTVKDDDGTVVVKYDDNEYFPAYVIHFHRRHDEYNGKYY